MRCLLVAFLFFGLTLSASAQETTSSSSKPAAEQAAADSTAGPAGDLVGTVVDVVTEKPIEGAYVQYFVVTAPGQREPVRAYTDAEGRFRLEDVPLTRPSSETPARQATTFFVGHDAYVPRGYRATLVDGEAVTVTIELEKRGS